MANKQPFYHSVSILFTATREVHKRELQEQLGNMEIEGLLYDSIEVECMHAEPGDPSDLM